MVSIPRVHACFGVALLLCGALLFGAGCGGGGEGDDGATPETGRAVLGPLAGATVEIYEVGANASFNLLFTETTSTGPDVASTGLFDAHREALNDNGLYLVKVTGGQDVDADDDGDLDDTPKENLGAIHAVGTGAMLKAGVFQVNMLTEIAYQGVVYLLISGYDPDDVVEGLDTYATYLLRDDVTGDGHVGAADLLAWDPLLDKSALRKHYDHYGEFLDAIEEGRPQHVPGNAAMLADISAGFVRLERVEDVVQAGSYAYAALHEDGVRVVDISDPRRPEAVASVDTQEADGLYLVGSLLYVADDDGLQIIDVTDPLNPVKRGKAFGGPGDDMEWADDVVVSGNYAYLAEGENGRMRVVDVSDPDNPGLVATRETGAGSADGIAMAGNYVYLADGDGVSVFDVTDPLSPNGVAGFGTEGDADAVAVSGNLLFVAAGGEDGLAIYDVTDPTHPVHVASEPAPMDCEGVAVHGNYVYLSQRDAGVQVFDVSDPANPISLGTCQIFGEMNGICCSADYALVAAEDDGGLRVVDVNPHSAELFTNTLPLPVVAVVDQYDVDDVVTDGRYAYLVTEDNVAALDLQDPANPVLLDDIGLIGQMDGEPTRAVLNAAGDLLYVTMGWRGIQIVDVSTPSALALRDQYDGHLGPQHLTVDVATHGNYVFTAETHHPRFLAIDVTDPDNVAHAGDNSGPNHGLRGVAMLDPTHVCCAWGFAGIQVVNVSNPSDPQIVGGDTLPPGLGNPEDGDFVTDVRTHGNYAYLGSDDGVWIVDASTPSSLTVTGQLDGPRGIDFAFHGSHIYVAAETDGIAIGNIADKANPTMVTRVPLEGRCTGIAVLGDYLLVAAWDHLLILRRPLTETVP